MSLISDSDSEILGWCSSDLVDLVDSETSVVILTRKFITVTKF